MAVIYLLSKVQEPLDNQKDKVIEAILTAKFPDRWRSVGNGCYLVAAPSTMITRDVSTEAGLTDGAFGAYIVSRLDTYWGWASGAIWEWISNMKASDDHP